MKRGSLSDSAVIIGTISIFVFVGFFWGLDAVGVTVSDDDFVIKITPYILIIGLGLFGSGIGYKIYKWKNSS